MGFISQHPGNSDCTHPHAFIRVAVCKLDREGQDWER
jgi:hypothetical protein